MWLLLALSSPSLLYWNDLLLCVEWNVKHNYSVTVLGLLLRPREWWSIVMSTSLCLCVCLSVCPWGYLRNHTRDLYQLCCACYLWPWIGPPPAGWRNPKGKGQFWWFSSPLTMHCNVFAAKRSVICIALLPLPQVDSVCLFLFLCGY